ncbi:putative FMN-binding regulatory protein PaiB [Bradyrhizobium sp. F1.4.3]
MLPVVLDERRLHGHHLCARLARSNLQWKLTPTGEAMAIFAGAQAYISPAWYVTKHDTGEP